MIDLQYAKKAFENYLNDYDQKNEKIKLKIVHTYGVMECSKKITEDMKLSAEDCELAQIIGLLHDIGRFEQARVYKTFRDKDSINHGEYGVKILFDNGLIREFIATDRFDEIIKLAILNHNRADIEKGLTERENLHARIIRDADKLDIFYVLVTGDKKAIWESSDLSNDEISDEIYREFMEDRVIDYKKVQTSAEILVTHFAYVYDFNFKQSLEIIKEHNYLDKLYGRFNFNNEDTREKIQEIYEVAKKYLEEKG